MKIKELIKQLQRYDDDEGIVVFSYDYGDRARTKVAQVIKRVDEHDVIWSDYHGAYVLMSDDHEDDEDDEDGFETMVVLS